MHKLVVGLSAFAVCIGALGAAATDGGAASATPPATGPVGQPPSSASAGWQGGIAPGSPIKHVVIIYQENHTFDDVLGTVCVADQRAKPCDGYVGPVTFADGTTAENVVQPDQVPVVDHNPHAQKLAMKNEWDSVRGCEPAPYVCISHVDPVNMQNLTRLANTFTVSDATFAAGQAASFGAHVTLGAGTFDGFRGHNPVNSKTGATPRYGWGCKSRKDALWGPRLDLSFQPTCIPDRKGRGPYRESEVPYTATIMERMEQAGLSWHIYEGAPQGEPNYGIWSVCTYFAWCWLHRWDLGHSSSRDDFVTAAGNGTLPNLSLLLPTGSVSQHNATSMLGGDNYIGQMVDAVMNGPDWRSTAIFITYDDCGCFYDHVTPPKHMGLRNPMVIISPYARPGGTDSTFAVQPYSMLSFTENVFGLAPLTHEVSQAYDYANSFDFSQQPLQGPRMTYRPVPLWEQRQVAKMATYLEQDPT